MRGAILCLALLISSMLCLRDAYAQGVRYPLVGGERVHCTDPSGAPVFTVSDPNLSDSAQSSIDVLTGVRLIKLNPNVLGTASDKVQLFAYAHECGHHLSGDIIAGYYFHHDNLAREKNADRIGIRLLRDQGLIDLEDAREIAAGFRDHPGVPPYYLPGPLREKWILDCFATSAPNCSAAFGPLNSGPTRSAENENAEDVRTVARSSPVPLVNGQGDFCDALNRLINMASTHFSEIRGAKEANSYSTSFYLPRMHGRVRITIDDDYATFSEYDDDIDMADIYDETKTCLARWREHYTISSDDHKNYYFDDDVRHVTVELVGIVLHGVSVSKNRNP